MNFIINNIKRIKPNTMWIKNNIKKIMGHKSPFKFLLHLLKCKLVFIIGDIFPFALPLTIFKYRRHNYYLHYAPNQFSQVLYTYPDIIRHPDDEEFLKTYLKHNDNYIDIGANIGTTTLCATAATVYDSFDTSLHSNNLSKTNSSQEGRGSIKNFQSGMTIAYEAHPLTFTYLARSILNNKSLIPRIITRNIALGDSEGVVGFSTIKNHDDINHVVQEDEGFASNKKINNQTHANNYIKNIKESKTKTLSKKDIIYVPIKRLDNELTFTKIDLIKIDVEGYELQVFKGAKNTLTKTQAVFFEIYDKNTEMFDYQTSEIINLLSDSGFKIYKIDITNKSLKRLDTYSYTGSPACENMIAVRDEADLLSRTCYTIIT